VNEERTESIESNTGPTPEFSPSICKLIGSYERTIDSKSRIGLPHQFRDKVKNTPLVMVRWLKRSLAIFPECNWLPFAEAIGRLDLYTDIGMTVRRQMFAHAREISMDKEGRIVAAPDMVDYARLDGKIMLSGDWDKIVIWNFNYYRDQVAVDDVTLSDRFPAVLQLAKGQKSLESFEAELSPKPDDAG